METFSQFYTGRQEVIQPQFLGINQQNKIVLTKNNVNLQFYFAGETQGKYKLSFIVNLVTPNMSTQIRASQIDEVSLKKAIWENVAEYDRKYIELFNFNSNKAEFYFNYDKWIDDAFKSHTLHAEFSVFNRRLGLKTVLPIIIRTNALRGYFEKFLEKKIKEFIKKKRLEKTRFIPFLPKEFSKSLNSTASNLFNYTYVLQENAVYIRLKPELVLAASLFLAMALKRDTNYKIDYKKPDFFDTVVKRHLNITSKDWNMKVNRKR